MLLDSLPTKRKGKRKRNKEVREFPEFYPNTSTPEGKQEVVLPETQELKLKLERKRGKKCLTSLASTHPQHSPIVKKTPPAQGLKVKGSALLSKCQTTQEHAAPVPTS